MEGAFSPTAKSVQNSTDIYISHGHVTSVLRRLSRCAPVHLIGPRVWYRHSCEVAIQLHSSWRPSPMLIWPSTCIADDASSTSSSASIHPPAPAPALTLDFTGRGGIFEIALHGNWRSFDTIISNLPHVHKLVLGFETRRDISRFKEEVLETSMSHVRTNLECLCAVLDHKEEDSWCNTPARFFVSPDRAFLVCLLRDRYLQPL